MIIHYICAISILVMKEIKDIFRTEKLSWAKFGSIVNKDRSNLKKSIERNLSTLNKVFNPIGYAVIIVKINNN